MDQEDLFIQKLKASGTQLIQAAKDSVQWVKENIQKLRNPMRIFEKTGMPTIGEMYMFSYDPKYKNILPYYDMYPLVIPIEMYADGFLGLNLHYLPPMARARLLDSLKKVANNDKYNNTTKLNVSYRLLKNYSNQFVGFENCVKRYLYAHVRSTFHQVSASEWDKAVLLPLQKWKINSNKKYAKNPPY